MAATRVPTDPGPVFREFLEKSEQIQDDNLASAIPPELFQPRVGRGVLGFVVSYALYFGGILGIAFSPHWLLWLPLLAVSGLGGWGLHCIAHDCGHNSFSRSRRFNVVVGHLALLPLAYPFHAWRHVHNLHHSHTNNLELDTDWRPLPQAMYRRMSWRERLVYAGTRKWAYWFGTINYWRVSAFRPSFFPKAEMRRDVRRSVIFVLAVGVVWLTGLVYFTGLQGVVLYFVAPWVAIHAWFSATTLMHHSAKDIPYLTSQDWTLNAARMLVTTDYVYPRWMLFLTHNISLHTAHHVAPIVPFYNLPQAQEALTRAYPGMLRIERFTFRQLREILGNLHLYDVESGFYESFSGTKVPPSEDQSDATLVASPGDS